MATNKNATIRYQTLDRCFRNPGRRYYMDDLINACNEALIELDPDSTGIKRRQIFEDIKFMKDSLGFNAPIESLKDGKKVYYRYDDINFSINSQPLNQQEAQQLQETLITLSRFKGMPQFDWVEEIKARLEQTFKLKTEENIISFEENEFLKGREFIGDLFNAIANKQVLKIDYLPFKVDAVLDFVIHPYHLKQYNNRWFLFGRNDNEDQITNLALDRISSISTRNTPYKPNKEIDFDEYFEDVIGVSVPYDGIPQKILLKVDAKLWPYIKTKPLHGSQKVKELTDNYSIIQLELILNYELEALIFSFGEKVEVLSPESLRQKIITRINSLNTKYL